MVSASSVAAGNATANAAAPSPSSPPPSHAWLIGVAINLVGSVSINLGTNLMKLGHNRRAALVATAARANNKGQRAAAEASVPPASAQRVWRAGVLLFALGNAANFASFAFAAQSLLAAIGSVQFLSNAVFARAVLGERVGRGAAAATAVIVAGCSLLVACGSHASRSYTVPELVACYRDPAYVAYVVVGGLAGLACYLGYRRGRAYVELRASMGGGERRGAGAAATAATKAAAATTTTTTIDQEEVVLLGDPRLLDGGVLGGVLGGLFGSSSSAPAAGKQQQVSPPSSAAATRGGNRCCLGLAARLAAAARRRGPPRPELVAASLPALYATFSALVGTQSVLFSKTLAVTLRVLLGGGGSGGGAGAGASAWGGPRYLPFLLAVPLLFFLAAAFWVARLNQGLRLFPGAVVVPAMQVAWTLLSVLSGMLHFGEYRDLSKGAAAGFAGGVAVVLTGVVLLSRASAASSASSAATGAAGARGSASPLSPAGPRAGSQARFLEVGGAGLPEALARKLGERGGAPAAAAAGLVAALRPGGGAAAAAAARNDSSRQLLLASAPHSSSGGGGGGGVGGGIAAPSIGIGGGGGGGGAAAASWLRRAASDFAAAPRGALFGLGDASLPAFSVFMPPMLFAAGAGAAAAAAEPSCPEREEEEEEDAAVAAAAAAAPAVPRAPLLLAPPIASGAGLRG